MKEEIISLVIKLKAGEQGRLQSHIFIFTLQQSFKFKVQLLKQETIYIIFGYKSIF